MQNPREDVNPVPLVAILRSMRNTLALLCCWGACWGVSAATGSPRDTITVDGVPLELNLDVRESETPGFTARSGRARTGGWKPVPHLALEAGAGYWTSDVMGVPVSRRAQRPISAAASAEAGLTWNSERHRWRTHVAFGAQGIRTLDLTSLEDSAVALLPDGAGGIEQHVVTTYELGQELDTLPVVLHAHALPVWRLGVAMGGRGRGRNAWSWWAGGFLQGSRLNRSPAQVERLPAAGVPEPMEVADEQRLDWVPRTSWGWGVSTEAEKALSDRWSWGVQFRWTSPPRGRVAVAVAVRRHFRR